MEPIPSTITFTWREMHTLRAALRLWETTMNKDELEGDVHALQGGNILSAAELQDLCRKAGIYGQRDEDGDLIEPFDG